jgi:PKD repeat protein
MQQNAVFTQALASSGSTPMTWGISAGNLPAGLGINSSTGVISGTPTGTGAYSFTVQATNPFGSDTQVLSGTIAAGVTPPNIVTTSFGTLTQNTAFALTLARTGDTPMTWTVSSGVLPEGLALNATTGEITGTPTLPGAYSVTIMATNSGGSDTQIFSGSVSAIAVTKSIFGSASPGNHVAYNDGAVGMELGSRFYATKPIRILGARLWNPVGSDAGFLAADLTAHLWGQDYTGTNMLKAMPAGSPARTKVSSGVRTAGTWTNILFDTPMDFLPVAAAANGPDVVLVSFMIGTGIYYVFSTGVQPLALVSTQEAGVFLAEADLPRPFGTVQAPNDSTHYGADILFEVI